MLLQTFICKKTQMHKTLPLVMLQILHCTAKHDNCKFPIQTKLCIKIFFASVLADEKYMY